MNPRDRETAALFALLKVRPGGVSWGQLASEVAFEGSAEAVLDAAADDGSLIRAFDHEDLVAKAFSEVLHWREQGLQFVTVLDDEYPARLLDIRETPPFLFYQGELRPSDVGMSVVGTRNASEQGLALATAVSEMLVAEGFIVIAGLAAGIDTAAHQAALQLGGRTVAFIGTGITQTYPASNRELQQEIASKGLVLSQFYPDAPPTKYSFPMRNASMSGYGLATIVIEAGEHSGARIQARLAREHGRPVILSTRVAGETQWGRAMIGEPGVYVASSVGELRDVVQDIASAPNVMDSALVGSAAW